MQLDEDDPPVPQQEEQNRNLVGLGAVNSEQEELLLPAMAFLPDGYIEPQGEMRLSFDSDDIEFNYSWGESGASILMERLQP